MSLTEAGVDDAEEADGLLKATGRAPALVATVGAYDKRKVYRALEGSGALMLIPPGGMPGSGGTPTPRIAAGPGREPAAHPAGRAGVGAKMVR